MLLIFIILGLLVKGCLNTNMQTFISPGADPGYFKRGGAQIKDWQNFGAGGGGVSVCAPSEVQKNGNFQSQFTRFGALFLPGAPTHAQAPSQAPCLLYVPTCILLFPHARADAIRVVVEHEHNFSKFYQLTISFLVPQFCTLESSKCVSSSDC